MIKLSVTELRIITGVKAKNIYNYKKREQLIQGDDKLYDYDNQINRLLIETHGTPGA